MYATASQTSASFYRTAGGVSQIIQAANGSPPPGAGLDARYTMGASHRFWTAGDQANSLTVMWNYTQPTFSTGTKVNSTRPSSLPVTLTATWPNPLPNGVVGSSYSFTLTATGGILPYTFAVATGTLPTGLSLNASTGVISGIPTVSASLANITFSVTDSA